ncbi:SAM-dependent methlyltransferase [Ectothiorhodospira haloalkaliphila]|uniref:SAM-dependent methlyltransferase n=1 Tax=Ectothiorhodospira haloalkaliphila TaxID=421628 RepID=W8L3U2_9GAMM|nr:MULTISPECIES: methyltransferase domain-containing protein [Ectothiorhodospira]AHK78595.1 SAM-dependent methlyltransferase [Ectothiorhodospira haloalkaliphila]MCG5493167.1 methyltransferase domain-containing protein [Ectothiorhodospira variabilis]MCG5497111.1 methyltransferase domain-containing protein [Ectothiorhodospira variabilis]MCG5502496.1 methyltransferase domain-containing protein [Ectothiorhodospira variabilis]MCG5505738.1 methyltransferase domain-containing protein [Ectothiorhodosp
MDLSSIKSAYRRYARYYDAVFGPIFAGGRRLAMEMVNAEPAPRVLEVGVGTGLSLPDYREDARVVGIDVSPDMLQIAKERAEEGQLKQVEALLEMDAECLAFADDSFDCVVAMYVASVVPNPDKLMREMQRVCVPGGDVLVINHFASSHPVVRRVERALRPLSRLVGFRPDMELDSLPELPGLNRVGVHKTNLFGYWKLVHYRNGEAPLAEPEQPLTPRAADQPG